MTIMLSKRDRTMASLMTAARKAAAAIPPLWPLATSVAVNPFLGQAGEPLDMAAVRLARLTGQSCTMPLAWYATKIADGVISRGDLDDALAAQLSSIGRDDVDAVLARPHAASHIPGVAELCAAVSGIDWPGFIEERFGAWAAGHFDEGQALWAAPRERGAYDAWRAQARHDLTPEIIGLEGFARFVTSLPDHADEVIARAPYLPGLDGDGAESYFQQLLISIGGWAQFARYRQWQAELAGGDDATLLDLLAIRLSFDLALFRIYGPEIREAWADSVRRHVAPVVPSRDIQVAVVLQSALERSSQRLLSERLSTPVVQDAGARPALQAAFCIDVRSEVFRRALESLSGDIQTMGFAGFFGLALEHRGTASDVAELRLPVLLNPGVTSQTTTAASTDADLRIRARASRAWGRFRNAAVSSFAFVEAAGPFYAGKLVASALSRAKAHAHHEGKPAFHPSLDLDARTGAAETILRAMSLTSGFARIVLLAGHGSSTVNNPHASALQCGACGGHDGEVNARLLAELLNDGGVRDGLVGRGIEIPGDTLFVGGLHDTTTDEVRLHAADHLSPAHRDELARVTRWLAEAGRLARGERALRLPGATTASSIMQRSRTWSEVRPEWGLAGCSAFIAAPRHRTRGRNLQGRSFLHDYDWRQDRGFGVLELILTAPVVVASWISLQYYGSTVAPSLFGSGNKLLHNVVGGIGVVEGSGGNLRTGLPLQSVHDGKAFVHEPLRLSVCVAAPREAISEILSRHDGVRALFDNGWLHLLAMDDSGRLAWRYAGQLQWTACDDRTVVARDAA